VLRIHFTTEDLLRVHLAAGPSPLPELTLAVAGLRRADRHPLAAAWRSAASAALPRPSRVLFDLIEPSGNSPLFLDPRSLDYPSGREQVLATPADTVQRDLAALGPRPPSPWMTDLKRQDRRAWQLLGVALDGAYRALVHDQWPRIQTSIHADLAMRSRLLAEHGIHAALSSLYPGAFWHEGTFCLPSEGEMDLRLDGRGLRLMPIASWTGGPLVGSDSDGLRLLVYRALTPLPLIEAEGDGDDPLAGLLGRTRAVVLSQLTRPMTTGQLARGSAISNASASEHAKALRAAGLVTTQRRGKSVCHSCTALGLHLLSNTRHGLQLTG
jgi:DNA-binding transcriptional ArsR family regulator